MGPATKSSNNKIVIAAKTTMKIRKAASFLIESKMPAKTDFLPQPPYYVSVFLRFSSSRNYYIEC